MILLFWWCLHNKLICLERERERVREREKIRKRDLAIMCTYVSNTYWRLIYKMKINYKIYELNINKTKIKENSMQEWLVKKILTEDTGKQWTIYRYRKGKVWFYHEHLSSLVFDPCLPVFDKVMRIVS